MITFTVFVLCYSTKQLACLYMQITPGKMSSGDVSQGGDLSLLWIPVVARWIVTQTTQWHSNAPRLPTAIFQVTSEPYKLRLHVAACLVKTGIGGGSSAPQLLYGAIT